MMEGFPREASLWSRSVGTQIEVDASNARGAVIAISRFQSRLTKLQAWVSEARARIGPHWRWRPHGDTPELTASG